MRWNISEAMLLLELGIDRRLCSEAQPTRAQSWIRVYNSKTMYVLQLSDFIMQQESVRSYLQFWLWSGLDRLSRLVSSASTTLRSWSDSCGNCSTKALFCPKNSVKDIVLLQIETIKLHGTRYVRRRTYIGFKWNIKFKNEVSHCSNPMMIY